GEAERRSRWETGSYSRTSDDFEGMTREAIPGQRMVVLVQGASLRGWEENPLPEVRLLRRAYARLKSLTSGRGFSSHPRRLAPWTRTTILWPGIASRVIPSKSSEVREYEPVSHRLRLSASP